MEASQIHSCLEDQTNNKIKNCGDDDTDSSYGLPPQGSVNMEHSRRSADHDLANMPGNNVLAAVAPSSSNSSFGATPSTSTMQSMPKTNRNSALLVESHDCKEQSDPPPSPRTAARKSFAKALTHFTAAGDQQAMLIMPN